MLNSWKFNKKINCQTNVRLFFGHIQAFVILLQSSNIQSNSLPIKKQTYEKDFLHHHRSHRHHLIFQYVWHLCLPKQSVETVHRLQEKIDISQLFDYRDPTYGYTISYPDFFEHEDTSLSNYQSYARFSYTDRANVVLESYVTKNHCTSLQTCADSLATKLHATKTMNRDSSFLLAGPVYENGVRMKGYSHYDKFIKSGKLLFVYSLTYPDDYKPAMSKLFHLIENWKIVGAY